MEKITLTLAQLESLLNQQKRLTAEKLLTQTYSYNPESTESYLKSLTIDKERFTELALKSNFPNDFDVLKKYLI